ncbi:cache domain-containing sensor histidine kinase [Paenibacillus abyssi]|nr:sensor histidine kinase [Paenibacillus abyssi]
MNNLPIRYKLITHFLLISILPSIGLGLLISWTVDRIIERQVADNTLQLISKVNKTLESYVDNMQNITYFIAFNPEVKQFLTEQEAEREAGTDYNIRQFLQGFSNLHSEIAGILVVNSRGDYISNELYARTDQPLTEEYWYKDAVDKKGIFTIIGQPVGRNLTSHIYYKDNEVVTVVRAILDPDTQQVQGVVLIDLKIRVIAEAAKDVRLGKTGYLTIMDDRGEMIYSPSEPYITNIPKEWLDENPSGSFSKQVEGRKLQFLFRTSSFTNWTAVGVFSTEGSVFEVQEIRFYVISFVFFVCLLGSAASLYLSHSISRPIGQLMSFMDKAESGDMTVRYWGSRTDEVGQLGRSYNNMLTQVNKLISLTELQERQKREAELKSLQAHIKPHFLYNTLDTIHWMARKKGADDVAEVVDALSRLFRIGLSKGNDMITIIDEFEHIHSYLKIQHTRYRDKLNYSVQIAESVQELSVLKLLLQPIVENAIYHGIKERRGPGHILISAEEQDGNLVIRVEDDGKGMSEEQLKLLRRKLADSITEDEVNEEKDSSGYGIMNVQARINLTFGDPYGLSIESELGQGTTVTIVHPIIRMDKRQSIDLEEGK